MVHWPEVMMSYESSEKVFFSADAFGKFGAMDADEGWSCEARRYYFNIVGKYGAQVQSVLKKAQGLEINTICPLHGPILTDTIGEVLKLYNTWSSYEAEDEGVFIAYASIHGNTAQAAHKMKEILEAKGCPRVAIADLSRDDIAECVEDSFRHSTLLCMASSYDGGVFAPMSDFINHLKSKAFQNRRVALVENGSWGPTAGRTMKAEFEQMKNIEIVDKIVTIKTTVKDSDVTALEELADLIK
jgi:flavorubredoxin